MSSTPDVTTFARLIGGVYAKVGENVEPDRLQAELSRYELRTSSDCGLIHVFHSGAGGMVDIAVDDEVFERYDAQSLGEAMCRTVQRAETAVRRAWDSVTR
jgi:DNA-binding protein YbaB